MTTLSRRLACLNEIGVDVYVRRDAPPLSGEPVIQPTVRGGDVAQGSVVTPVPEVWQRLERQVSACTACGLHAARTQTVFGVGDRHADWMFIGEAPGFEEDHQGEPFVGRAGKLLDKMLAALGFDRSRVYIANVIKCRPPDNRNPQTDELAACNSYLQEQIKLVRPRIIVALGGVAAHTLLNTEVPVGKLRGRVYSFGETGIRLVVTYHPAYLLRAPQQKRKAWEDLQLAQRAISEEEAG